MGTSQKWCQGCGWPMYLINFTPEQPGPLVRSDLLSLGSILITCSRNSFYISKMPRWRYTLKNLMMKTQISLVRTERLLASWSTYQSKSKSVMNGAYIKLSPTRKPYDTENIKTYSVKAIPVVLGGMEKDPISLKRKIIQVEDSDNDDDTSDSFQWLPPRSRREIPPHMSIRSLQALKTIPTSLKPVGN